jgi:integrase
VRARRGEKLPTVLSQEEIRRLLDQLDGTLRLVGELLYGCGLRLRECLHLRIKDIDFSRMAVEVRRGKGGNDRLVMLPERTAPTLRDHLERVKRLWESDRKSSVPGVEMPDALDRKMPNAGESWPWHWVFPSRAISSLHSRDEAARHGRAQPAGPEMNERKLPPLVDRASLP